MKKITKITYETFFGYQYDTKKECMRHEKIMHTVTDILSPLKSIPEESSLDWYNNGGYIQQDINVVNNVRDTLLLYLKELINNREFDSLYERTILENNSGRDLFGVFYYLDWTEYRYLMTPVDRLVCIDKRGREYGKQFFMLNPNERKHKEIKCK